MIHSELAECMSFFGNVVRGVVRANISELTFPNNSKLIQFYGSSIPVEWSTTIISFSSRRAHT
jgi:hypothetical protein